MSIKTELKNSIYQILIRNLDGSYATQADRRGMLYAFAQDLLSLNYNIRDIRALKQKHITAVIDLWKSKNLSNSTMKNRMSALRYISEKINKPNLIASNDKLGIGRRIYVTKENRALNNPDFSKISNPHIYVSLQLQKLFGLRREESLKIKPHLADKGNKLELLPSWCKGGRGRSIPIRTEEQREWLDKAKLVVGKVDNSLIPENKNYIKQRNVYDKQVIRAGLRNLHGLRHAYAQMRYKEFTGWNSPNNGGPKSCELTNSEKEIDLKARLILSEELGHSREQITVNYLGR